MPPAAAGTGVPLFGLPLPFPTMNRLRLPSHGTRCVPAAIGSTSIAKTQNCGVPEPNEPASASRHAVRHRPALPAALQLTFTPLSMRFTPLAM
jgi:hypothetical protein